MREAATEKNRMGKGGVQKTGRVSYSMKRLYDSRYLYLMILPVIVYFFIFHYLPMYGLTIAFRDFNAYKGIMGSPWAGLKHFRAFFESHYAWRLVRNTILINLYDLVVGFPIPVLLALLINEIQGNRLKRGIQTIVYMPHFISVVVICGMLISFLSPSTGMINHLIEMFGGKPIHFLADPKYGKPPL